jgi:hypothetical protein
MSDTTPEIVDYRYDVSEAFEQRATAQPDQSPVAASPRQVPALVEQFAAIIRSMPCSSGGGSDYTDARYYLDRAVASSTTSSPLSVIVDALPGVGQCLTATNLAELAAGTHLLAVGTVVQVFALYTRAGLKRYVFNQPAADGAVVQITATADGGGKYMGRLLTGGSTAVAAGDLAMPEGMSIPSADNALILNEEEDGLDGHRLSIPCFAVGQIAGSQSGLTVVMIRGALGATASPAALGDGSAGSIDPDSTSWSKSSDGTPLDIWVQTRTFWDSSTGTLFGYLRQLSFDARGVLYAVSGENQVTVDVAVACE